MKNLNSAIIKLNVSEEYDNAMESMVGFDGIIESMNKSLLACTSKESAIEIIEDAVFCSTLY